MCINMEGTSTMPTGNGQAAFSEEVTSPSADAHEENVVGKAVAAVAVVAVGAALFEVALLPGIARSPTPRPPRKNPNGTRPDYPFRWPMKAGAQTIGGRTVTALRPPMFWPDV
jgi:hypothetical protein